MTKPKPARLPGQAILCAWCRTLIPLRQTGRIPKWCSSTCRHRAWEQRRAAASGRTAIEVIDRVIEVEKPIVVVERVEVPIAPRSGGWPDLLTALAKQIDTGRIYDRDLQAVAEALGEALGALDRRRKWRRHQR